MDGQGSETVGVDGRAVFVVWHRLLSRLPVRVMTLCLHLHSLVSQSCIMVASVVVFGLLATGIRVTMVVGSFPGYCNNAFDALAP